MTDFPRLHYFNWWNSYVLKFTSVTSTTPYGQSLPVDAKQVVPPAHPPLGLLWKAAILFYAGLLIFRERKAKFHRNFRGKFVEKLTDFVGEKSKFTEKSVDFTGNFGGKLRQETISKKQPISLDFFWQISLKSINFASIWPALFSIFLTGIRPSP